MGKKKRDEAMSILRYKMAQYKEGLKLCAGNEELAMKYAEARTDAYVRGSKLFRRAYEEIKPILIGNNVPKGDFFNYHNFKNEFISKVFVRKIATAEQIIEKWTRQGLNPDVLKMCSEKLIEVIPEIEKEM